MPSLYSTPLDRLTPGERLWIWMRRRGMKNADLIRIYGVHRNVVHDWMKDRAADVAVPEVALVEPIEWHEIIAVARRRIGWPIWRMGKALGISHVTMIRLERGDGDVMRAVGWWRRRGWPMVGVEAADFDRRTTQKPLRRTAPHRRKPR